MHIEKIHEMLEKLASCAENEFQKGIECVDAEEMEKVSKIIESLANAEYLSEISKTMKNYDYKFYSEPHYRMPMEVYRNYSAAELRDLDRKNGKMYYTEQSRYEIAKKHYQESQNGTSVEEKSQKMRNLEDFLKEIAEDLTKVIENSTQEEKMLVRNKLQVLTQKIQ